ncbi:hypothetical protein [Basfia succiniciproducens]|uniref:hypothetical protein n=1 Tax=Basfia succiniciproducens TaxID=653940 RepID=UPI0008B259C8|nr:hypothetical protein [Basfia succiniciproducens]SEP76845.1 hypothetical protein SAMN02910415_00420 [Basfia succiniciproducens]
MKKQLILIGALVGLAACATQDTLPTLEMTLSNGQTVAVDCQMRTWYSKATKEKHYFNDGSAISKAVSKRCVKLPDYMNSHLNATGQRQTFIFVHK